MSAVKAARAAKATADRSRTWYVMTSRVGREAREKRERRTGAADCSGLRSRNDNEGGNHEKAHERDPAAES